MTASRIPDTDLARIRRWCAEQSAKLPPDQLRIGCVVGARAVIVGEERPPWNGTGNDPWEFSPVARLTYVISRREWSLAVSTGVDAFRRYTPLPNGRLTSLLDEIDVDPTFVFWG